MVQTSNFDREAYEAIKAERERMLAREACEHLKYQALELTIEVPEIFDEKNYAHFASADIDSTMNRGGFPKRLFNVSFGSFSVRDENDERLKSRLLAYCSKISPASRASFQPKEPASIDAPSFGMYGPPGTGKTFAAVCVAKEAGWLGHKSMYTTVSSLAREVRSTFRKGSESSEESILAKYSKTPLLIMDEIGAGTGSDHERAMFTDVISERYNAKRPTILISNLNLKDFKDALGERVTDRLSEDGGFILPVLGESRRRE